jgi:hypothetical protein
MKALYLAIVAHIRTLLPEVKFYDLFDGQYENEEDEDQIAYPAIFIDFDNMEWNDQGAGVLEAQNAIIRLHICSQSSERATQGRDAVKMPPPALNHLGLVDKVNKAFHGAYFVDLGEKALTLTTDLQKGPQTRPIRRAGLKVDVVGYNTTLYDYSSSQWSKVEEVD